MTAIFAILHTTAGGSDNVQMLVPESWLGYQVTMEVEHDYVDTGSIIRNTYMELNCTTCGCSEFDEIYSLNETENIITECKYGLQGQVTISSQINGQIITDIGANVFVNQTGITCITLPRTVTSIGSNAFNGCTSLTAVSGISNVQSIGENAFGNCSELETIILPSRLQSIGQYAFLGCTSLIEIELPEDIATIGDMAFSGYEKLEKVYLAEGIGEIGNDVFQGCNVLTVYAEPQNKPETWGSFGMKTNAVLKKVDSLCAGYRSVCILQMRGFGKRNNLWWVEFEYRSIAIG